MLRLLDVRYFLPLLLNLIGWRLLPLTEVLTGYPTSVLFNLALCVRLMPKIYLFIHISLYTFLYTHLSTHIFLPIWLRLYFTLLRPWACKFKTIFPAFYSKNCLQKLENKPAIYRPLSRSHQSKKLIKKFTCLKR